MANFKTISENGTMASSQGILKVLASGDSLMQDVEMWLLNDVKNRNRWTYQNLEQHRPLFAGIPILVAYVDGELGKKSGHNFKEVRKPDGNVVASFLDADAEHIVGYIPTENDVRIEHKDGQTWIVAKGKIWTWYAQELVGFLKEQGLDGQQISIETLVNEVTKDADGDEVYPKWTPIGVTVLGTGVQEAVENAYIRALSALGIDQIREKTKIRVASVYAQEQQNNPQTKNKKENKTTMKLKDLKDKFAGFKVLAVDGEKVALLSEKGETFVSTATKDTTTGEVVEGVKTAVNATVAFGDGDEAVKVALDTVIDKQNAEIADLAAKLEKRNSEFETVKNALDKMCKQETERRKDEVKNAVNARLAEIKASNSEVDFAENECDDLLTDEKLSEYVEMVDKDGKFIGADRACRDVDNRCMSKLLDARKAKQNAGTRQYAWNRAQDVSDSVAGDDVDKLIAKFTQQ